MGKRSQKKGSSKTKESVPLDHDELGGDYDGFITDMAALEGAPRFLHTEDVEGSHDLVTPSATLGKNAKLSLEAMLASVAPEKGREATKAKAKAQEKEWKLSQPLSDPAAKMVARKALYERAKADVGQWNALVHSRRAAETLSFPIQSESVNRLETQSEAAKHFKAQTPLEREVAALLHGSASTVKSGSELSQREESILSSLSYHEALEKRKELARLRALQSYQEAKMKRQRKIKSRSYRKVVRKQKAKEKLQEMAELQKTNPELAQERLEEMDRGRIAERASLKHRNSSKYLKMQAKRAKYSKESQVNLQEQLDLHRSLMAKPENDQEEQTQENSSDSDNEIDLDDLLLAKHQEASAVNKDVLKETIMASQKAARSPDKKKQSSKELQQAILKKKAQEQLHLASNIDDLFQVADHIIDDKIRDRCKPSSKNKGDNLEEPASDADEVNEDVDSRALPMPVHETQTNAEQKKQPAPILDPDRFVATADVSVPVLMDSDHEEDGENGLAEQQKADIIEAFADDQVDIDFSAEKKAAILASKPKDIDLTLPGWGSWGGEGLSVSKRKRKRFIVKAPPAPKRRDENKGHLILNDHKNESLRGHQVNQIPFPFNSVASFEASIRAPVGETFVPRVAFKRLVKPRVNTKAGHVIEPIQKESLLKRQK